LRSSSMRTRCASSIFSFRGVARPGSRTRREVLFPGEYMLLLPPLHRRASCIPSYYTIMISRSSLPSSEEESCARHRVMETLEYHMMLSNM